MARPRRHTREPEKPPRPTFKHGAETIRVFASPESLMRELRNEARVEGGSPSIAREVWRLAKVEDSQPTAEQAEGPASHSDSGSRGCGDGI